MDAVVADLEPRSTADADGPGRMQRSSKPKLNGSWQGICQAVEDHPDPLAAPDLLVGRQPDRKRGNVQLRQHRYDRRIRSHQMSADKTDPEAGPDRLPHHDQVVGPESKLFLCHRETPGSKRLANFLAAVTADEVVFEQIGGLARHAMPAQVILARTGLQRHLSDPPRNERRLLGLDHPHCNIRCAPQEVADGITGHQLDLNVGQGQAYLCE
jgi:hypothetical protein